MSYTVIVDHAEERRQFENRINAVMRHCRIGKVKRKSSLKLADALKHARPTGSYPLTGSRPSWPPFSF